MMRFVFGETGSLVHPALHDACLYRIDFGSKQVKLFCRAPDGQCSRLELHGIAHMQANGLAEQNILLDVCLEDDEKRCVELLGRLLPGSGERQQEYRNLILQRLVQKSLMFLRFSPSYGGEILVLCEEALYENEP
jgi:hypothetical protein